MVEEQVNQLKSGDKMDTKIPETAEYATLR